MTTQHTAGPWKVVPWRGHTPSIMQAGSGALIAHHADGWPRKDQEANIAFIVLACNSHEALLAAAQDMMATIQRLRACPKCKEQECGCWEAAAHAISTAL